MKIAKWSLLICGLVALTGSLAYGQTPDTEPTVRLTAAQTLTFRSALAQLAAQVHCAVVAEGVPLHPTLDAGKSVDLSAGTPLTQAVSQIAAAFDYDAQRIQEVYVLKKRYTDAADLPTVTLSEVLYSVQNIDKTIKQFSPNLTFTPQFSLQEALVDSLVRTLSPEQLKAMGDTSLEHALRVADLSPEQRSLVQRDAMYLYTQHPEEEADIASAYLQLAKTAVFSDSPVHGKPTFGYALPGSKFGSEFFFLTRAIDNPPMTEPDMTALAQVPAETLETAVSRITAPAGAVPPTVEPTLREKPIMLAGSQYATETALLAALAELYGLRIKVGADHAALLTYRQPVYAADAAALPQVVRHDFPAPLLRYLKDESVTHQETLTRRERFMLGTVRAGRPAQIRSEAVRRLELACRPLLAKSGAGGRVPFSALPAEAQRDFALILLQPFLHNIGGFELTPPPYIAQFDQTYVTGHPYPDPNHPGQKVFSLNLGCYEPGTQSIHNMAGIGYGL